MTYSRTPRTLSLVDIFHYRDLTPTATLPGSSLSSCCGTGRSDRALRSSSTAGSSVEPDFE